MRQPKELSDDELRTIAASVKKGLAKKFGEQRMSLHIQLNHDIVHETFRLTYIAVREQLEKEFP